MRHTLKRHAQPYVAVVECTSSTLSEQSIAPILFGSVGARLVVGFVSPHIDFQLTSNRLRQLIPSDTALILVSTAGELYSKGENSPYCNASNSWDRIILQGFSKELIQQVSVHSIPLPNDDIRNNAPTIPHKTRVERITASLKNIRPSFPLDYRETFALTFVDGLSCSESCLMEAAYNAANLPLLYIGGSAGGKLDFKQTQMFDGSRIVENHAIICLTQMAPNKSYGVLKSQNFRKTATHYVVFDADPDRRIVRTVINPETMETMPFLQAVAQTLGCHMDEVKHRLNGRGFGIDVEGELYVRMIATFDDTTGAAHFLCSLDYGDELYLLEPTDFVTSTQEDVQRFLRDKPKPVGALLNDCVLRRLTYGDQLSNMHAFEGIPVAGFSTFGELLGLNINQTVVALYFFDSPRTFKDDLIDRFPAHYASFQAYFLRRQIRSLKLLNDLRSNILGSSLENASETMSLLDSWMQTVSETQKLDTSLETVHGHVAAQTNVIQRDKENTQQVAADLKTLITEMSAINSVLTLLQRITDQTHMLALNATIEAARAGDLGKGFAVVAQEVKALANDTNKAVDESRTSLNAIVGSSHQLSDRIEQASMQMAETARMSEQLMQEVQQALRTAHEVRGIITAHADSVSKHRQTTALAIDNSEKVRSIEG